MPIPTKESMDAHRAGQSGLPFKSPAERTLVEQLSYEEGARDRARLVEAQRSALPLEVPGGCLWAILSPLWLPWAVSAFALLYPFAAGAAVGVALASRWAIGVAADPRVKSRAPASAIMRWEHLGLLAGVPVLWVFSRLEQRLARRAWYRVPRNVLRVALVGACAAASLLIRRGFPPTGRLAYIKTVLLTSPEFLVVAALAMLIAIVVLRRQRLREWWHGLLATAGLRS